MQFAIDSCARCQDDVLDSGRCGFLGNDERSHYVDGDVPRGDSTGKRARCEMNNHIRTKAPERPGNSGGIPNVGLRQRHAPRKTFSMTCRQIVNDKRLVARIGQRLDDVRSEKACPTGHEHPHAITVRK